MSDQNDHLFAHMTIDVAENGYILKVRIPEGRKTLTRTRTRIYVSKTDLYDGIGDYLNEFDQLVANLTD